MYIYIYIYIGCFVASLDVLVLTGAQSFGFAVSEIVPGGRTYYITEGFYQMMFVTHCTGVVVVDAPPSLGPNILAAIAKVTSLPITHVVYSHHHADHSSAAGRYPPAAAYIAHAETLKLLQTVIVPLSLILFFLFLFHFTVYGILMDVP